jgi:ABC-type transport system involved in cytochrome c biogenesis permease subunit
MFLLGAVGALAPEIIRLYEIRNDPQRFTWSWFYLIVSILFVALGGFVAVVLPSKNPQGAFYAGISTPVLVNTVLKKGSTGTKLKGMLRPGPALSPFRSFVSAL